MSENTLPLSTLKTISSYLFLVLFLSFGDLGWSATVSVGSGSYTTTFPGVDSAGRNGLPGGSPQLSGDAIGRPVPTNDWWSALLNSDHAGNLFNYPLSMGTLTYGLDVGYLIPVSGPNGSSEPRDPFDTIVVGVAGLNASRATVGDYSDWTVTIDWASNGRSFRATSGIGMPFVYFSKGATDTASVLINEGIPTVIDEILLVTDSQGGANFAIYAPEGSIWVESGNTYTSTLNGKNYWSLAMLPSDGGTPLSLASEWQQYAYVEPAGTEVTWSYHEDTAILRTDFTTIVRVNEGEGNTVIQGLLPHQWAHLSSGNENLTNQSLNSIRGELKLLASNTFSTERKFQGVLPTLPAIGIQSESFDPSKLNAKISAIQGDGLATWTDSYNEGQVMNRLIQTARIAHEIGNLDARDQMIGTVKERLEDWLTYQAGEVAFLFHYSDTWTALFGYPGGHGQDTNINDHHFHWGYFIHAAAFLEQFEPGWSEEWGDMVNLLVRDAASADRNDPLFPFLRNFSPFAGHAWANGFATFPFGNDQESTSESMQFNTSLIHWGAITGDEEIRDLGIYLYTTEQSAVEEYWFDIHERNFKSGYGYALASRVWGNGYDNQTFWTSDIAAAYGIELYPIHGGSLYLGENIDYAKRLWAEIAEKTGILNQAVNPNLWHDIYWQFLAFTDPVKAIELYNGNPDRSLKFGVSDAQTYYWLHSMNALGAIDSTVTADDPLAAVFSKDGKKTYVAHNYSDAVKTISFSDGTELEVMPNHLSTSQDAPFSGSMRTPFSVAPVGGTVNLEVDIAGRLNDITRVDIFDGATQIATISDAPYILQTDALNAGRHAFYARMYGETAEAFSDLVTVAVGEQVPFSGVRHSIPGAIEVGAYDRFEGGNGNGIAYFDASPGNAGDHRPLEDVDAVSVAGEGSTVGWIDDGEWLEYSITVEESGVYDLDLRYASDSDTGGGPFFFEISGKQVSPNMMVPSSGGWDIYETATFSNIELPAGEHVLRLHIRSSGMNLGEMSFIRRGSLGYFPPVADAGTDLIIPSDTGTATLDGSGSTVEPEGSLSYKWTQVFGPLAVTMSDSSVILPQVFGLDVDGIYRFQLTVEDGERQDLDFVDIVVGDLNSRPPSAVLFLPADGSQVIAGNPIKISAVASDSDGTVVQVDFYNGDIYLGTRYNEPYELIWSPPEGQHALLAKATDSDGLIANSVDVALTANPPVPCRSISVSGDFEVEFSADLENPTVTFIPSRAGVGDNIVIFYPGQGGVIIEPNVPFRFSAAEGQTISYYFTYSVPEGGERNTIAENATFTVGACAEAAPASPEEAMLLWLEANFELEALQDSALEATIWGEAADPDGDEIGNVLEFYSGSDPNEISSSTILWNMHGLHSVSTVRYSRRAGLPESFAVLQWSKDLVIWSSDDIENQSVSLQDGLEIIEAKVINESVDPSDTLYWRLRIEP